MTKSNLSTWDASLLSSSPLFHALTPFLPFMHQHKNKWPSLCDYDYLLDSWGNNLCSASGAKIQFVPQSKPSNNVEACYEARIYLHGEVQTRIQNWHDFFQLLIWCSFPKTKVALNRLHYYESTVRREDHQIQSSNRGPLENALTLFDECGAIVVSNNNEYLEKIHQREWKSLFWNCKEHLNGALKCFVFGHAMYEKAIAPYIGMTSPSILMLVENSFFSLSLQKQIRFLDNAVADQFLLNKLINTPKDLTPFPLLGMPGWSLDNKNELYYENKKYFRPKNSDY